METKTKPALITTSEELAVFHVFVIVFYVSIVTYAVLSLSFVARGVLYLTETLL